MTFRSGAMLGIRHRWRFEGTALWESVWLLHFPKGFEGMERKLVQKSLKEMGIPWENGVAKLALRWEGLNFPFVLYPVAGAKQAKLIPSASSFRTAVPSPHTDVARQPDHSFVWAISTYGLLWYSVECCDGQKTWHDGHGTGTSWLLQN